MLFGRIRRTGAAFKNRNYPERKKMQATKREPYGSVNAVVTMAFIVPIAIVSSSWIENFANVDFTASSVIISISSILLTIVLYPIIWKLLDHLPFHLLNPYFGGRLERVIEAFRRKPRDAQ